MHKEASQQAARVIRLPSADQPPVKQRPRRGPLPKSVASIAGRRLEVIVRQAQEEAWKAQEEVENGHATTRSLYGALSEAAQEQWRGCIIIPILPGAQIGQAILSGVAAATPGIAAVASRRLAERISAWP